jgi:hypothetical protein
MACLTRDLNTYCSEPFFTEGVGLVHPSKVEAFFDDYHHSLKMMGVDGVKVDAQSVLPTLSSDRYFSRLYTADSKVFLTLLCIAEGMDGS